MKKLKYLNICYDLQENNEKFYNYLSSYTSNLFKYDNDDELIEYSTDPELIYEKYQELVDAVVDGGYGDNEPSTVINCTTGDFEIIREGKGNIEDYL